MSVVTLDRALQFALERQVVPNDLHPLTPSPSRTCKWTMCRYLCWQVLLSSHQLPLFHQWPLPHPKIRLECFGFGAARQPPSDSALGFWAPQVLAFPLNTRALYSLLPSVHCLHLQRVRANNREICFAWPTVGFGTPRQVATQPVDGVRWRRLSCSSLCSVPARGFRIWKHQCSEQRGAGRCVEGQRIALQEHG